jgi:hypothetical protein
MSLNGFGKYMVGSLLCGGIRSAFYSQKMKDNEGNRMPIGTRLCGIVVATGLAPILLPYYLICDINFVDRKYFIKSKIKDEVFPFFRYYIHENPTK